MASRHSSPTRRSYSSASAVSAAAPSPANEGPCISARVFGASFARPRSVAPMPGLRDEYLKMSSAAIAGPTTSPSVKTLSLPSWVKQVAAQQRAGRLLVEDAGVPAVRGMRRIDEAHPLAADVDHLAVGEDAGRPVGEVIQGDEAAGGAVGRRRLRGGGEPFVHGAALVGLEMPEGDPAQPLGGHDAREGVAIERKHLAQSRVEHERLVAEDEELVEGEAGRRGDVRDESGQAENAEGDFIDLGLHGMSPGLGCRFRVRVGVATWGLQ